MVNLIYFSRQGGVYASQIVLLLCSPQWVGYKHVLLFLPGQSAVSFFLCLGHVVIDIFSSLVATKCPARFKLRSTSLMFLSSDRCCPELTPRLNRLKFMSNLQANTGTICEPVPTQRTTYCNIHVANSKPSSIQVH